MSKTKEYGEYFPGTLSPFGYNETVAQEYFQLTKTAVIQQQWSWYEGNDQSINTKFPICSSCHKNFNILSQEAEFYKAMNLAKPTLCPDCRHVYRMKLCNPKTLYESNCTNCGQSIKTTFAPDRPKTVYCEECYNKEIY